MECLLDIALQRQSTLLTILLQLILGDNVHGLSITEPKRWAFILTLIWGMAGIGSRKPATKPHIHQLNIVLLASLLDKLVQTQLTGTLRLWSRSNQTGLFSFQKPTPKDLELFLTAHLIKQQRANLLM